MIRNEMDANELRSGTKWIPEIAACLFELLIINKGKVILCYVIYDSPCLKQKY